MLNKSAKLEELNSVIKGDDGRLYRKGPDGKLTEVYDPKAAAKRLLDGISAKHTVTGLRITDSDDPDAPAVVVTLTPAEAKAVVAAVKDVLSARAK